MINKQIEKYRIIRLIGEGGMAKVYEAVHSRIGSKVAIKVLNEELVKKTNIRQRFENEAKIMAELNHPNIVNIIDYIDEENTLAIVMELLQGVTLTDYLKEKKKLSKDETISIFNQVLNAFDLAHQKGIIHRDIKPSNIFIETQNNNNVKILDFGIAKLISSDLTITNSGAQMGSPLYMSPEQVRDASNIDNLSDIYSLGVVLFHMLNGKPAYADTTLSKFDIFNKIVYEELPTLQGYPKINKIIQKATKKKPSDRYLTCRDFANDLNNNNQLSENSKPKKLAKKINPSPTKTKTEKRKVKKQKSNKGVYITISIIVLMLLGVAGYFIVSNTNKDIANKEQKAIRIKPAEKTQETQETQKEKIKTFNKFFGSNNKNEVAKSIIETNDNEYIVTGYIENSSNNTSLIYRLNNKGNEIVWNNRIKNKKGEIVDVIKTNDDSYIFGGSKLVSNNRSIWLAKLSNNGSIEWNNTYGKNQSQNLSAIIIDSDNNCVVAGYRKVKRKKDAYIFKIDQEGKQIKQTILKNEKNGKLYDLVETKDGYVFVGEVSSKAWVLKTDKNLTKLWSKSYSIGKRVESVLIDNDNILIAGTKLNGDEDTNIFLMKIDANGQKIWNNEKVYGDEKTLESSPKIIKSFDNGYLIVSNKYKNDDTSDIWVITTGSAGNILRNKTILADSYKSLTIGSISKTNDNGYIIVGTSENVKSEKKDVVVIKFDKHIKY